MRSALPNLVKVNLSNSEPTEEQLNYLFSSLNPVGKITSLNLEEVDLTGIAPELFDAKLVDLNWETELSLLNRFKQSGLQWSRHLTFN